MEATLPISAAAKTRAGGVGVRRAEFGATAPSVTLPFGFAIAGLLALCAAIAWLVGRPSLLTTYHYAQDIIAVTHLFVLGWICSVVMGATYQLVPVALDTRLYSEKLARVQFVLHAVGFLGMVWMFHVWNLKQVGHFGSIMAVSIGLFVYNIGQTLRRVSKWSTTATAVASALTWVCLAALAGLSIATFKAFSGADINSEAAAPASLLHGLGSIARLVGRFDSIGAMHAHAHLGAIGCFTLLIVGVSYKVIPMFTLSEVQSRWRATASVALLNLGLAGCFTAILLRASWKTAAACCVIAALALYGWELAAILRHRKRRALDWGIKYFVTAIGVLPALAVVGGVLSWPRLPLNSFTGQLENLYGFLAFVGFITFAILGMLYKILPFLIWFKSYSRHIGRAQVPSLADLYSSRLQLIGYWFYLAGLASSSVGIMASSEMVTRLGCILLAATLATIITNVALMSRHLLRPQLKPISINRTPALSPV